MPLGQAPQNRAPSWIVHSTLGAHPPLFVEHSFPPIYNLLGFVRGRERGGEKRGFGRGGGGGKEWWRGKEKGSKDRLYEANT